MNTSLVGPEEVAPYLGQGKPAQQEARFAGRQRSRRPGASSLEEPKQTWLQRIRNRSWVMRACSTLWPALAIAVSLFAAPLRAEFAYVANEVSNNVSGYTINPSTGALTAIAGSPFAAGSIPSSVAVHPSGKFAYGLGFTERRPDYRQPFHHQTDEAQASRSAVAPSAATPRVALL